MGVGRGQNAQPQGVAGSSNALIENSGKGYINVFKKK